MIHSVHDTPFEQKVMWQFNLSGLPPPYETGRCAIIEACIGKAMTDCRHHIKTKVNESLKADARAKDIASLAAQIIGRSRIKPTAALYMRLANICWAITQLPGKFSEDAFWVKFDAILEGQRAKYTEPGHLYTAVKKLYDDDVKKFGEPDLVSYRLSTLTVKRSG
ncbi:hypothetical protein TRAPUB_10799 [Trametes pubescens]|uniref:Uncharacterized protein n=1 Tax=Trametes pubescens TaxID=154538 RepID=A0A1M2VYN3_TRAPU|nr:hypothetical protein TRAPUB_10799 [Trametes pubescens]